MEHDGISSITMGSEPTRSALLWLPLDAAHLCHTCRFLHASGRAKAVLAEHAAEVEARVLPADFLACASREALTAAG